MGKWDWFFWECKIGSYGNGHSVYYAKVRLVLMGMQRVLDVII
jgi:hypothetical protein